MPVSRTLTQLRAMCRQRIDFEQSDFVDDAELTDRINEAAASLHAELTQKLGGEFLRAHVDLTTTPGTRTLPLQTATDPARSDIFKLESVEILVGTEYHPIYGVKWQQRHHHGYNARGRPTHFARSNFREAIPEIELFPIPQAAETIRVTYVPNFAPLVDDGDEMVLPENWFPWIAFEVAIGLTIKEEGSMYRALSAERERIQARIDALSTDIDHENALEWVDEEQKLSGGEEFFDESDWRWT